MSETQPIDAGDSLRSIRADRVRMIRELRSHLLEHREATRAAVRRLLSGFRMERIGLRARMMSEGPSEGSLSGGEQVKGEHQEGIVGEAEDLLEVKSRVLRIMRSVPAEGVTVAEIKREVGTPQKVLSNALRQLVNVGKLTRTKGRYRERRED